MAKTKTKKGKNVHSTKQADETKFYESAEAIQEELSKSQEFVDKNKTFLTAALTVLVLIIGAVFFYNYTVDNQNREAQEQLFPAVFYLEKDSVAQAMQGDGNYTDGFAAIADEYSMTEAGNLASFYAGFAALKQGDFDAAIEYLNSFSSSDYLVQARAYCLTGDAYMEKGEFASAVDFYNKAANYKSNEEFTPMYLLKLALAQEQNGNKEAAASTYQTILDDYKNSSEATEAKKFKGTLGL